MLSRRKFAACALCAAAGFGAMAVGEANAQMPAGLKRTILSKTEMPDGKYVALLVAVEIEPGTTVPRHAHPGVESAYCLGGSAQLSVKGQPDRMVKAGDGFQVPTETPHGAKATSRSSSWSPTRSKRTSRSARWCRNDILAYRN
jgi:quercetin dioxygenase-like cupin family protein